jgi:mono/diheme cytochrome c family protein
MVRKLVAAVSIALLSAVLAAGPVFAAPGGIGPPSPETPSGEAISRLYWIVLGLCAIVFVLVETALILFIVRFRRRRDTPESAEGPQIHGNTRLEIIWTAIPAITLAAQQQPLALGQATWEGACATCHGLNGQGDVGPPIAGNGTLTNPEALHDLLLTGQNTPQFDYYMPPAGRGWPQKQFDALSAYIKSNEALSTAPATTTTGGGG